MALVQGQVLNNRYRIVKLLGQGGFGAVYRAWDMNLNGPCALKENFDTSPVAQAQFQREASMLFNLRHPNLPKVFDSFTIPGQGQYLAMEYIEGEDLNQMLERTGTALPEPQALSWIAQVCDALQYLHEQTPPVIHRDLKPANIRITPRGQAILVDFGIAKIYDPNLRTTTGARAVTPGYSPNEQYLSQGRTDARSDIYALGATLFTLLTCQRPPEAPERNMGVALPPIRSINPAVSAQVEAAVIKAMEVAPDRRYQSMAEFKKALSSQPVVYSGQPTAPSLSQSQSPISASQSKNSNRIWLYVLGSVFVLAVLLWTVFGGDGGRNADLASTQTALAGMFEHLTETARPTLTPRDTPGSTATLLPPDRPTSTETPLLSATPADFSGMALIPAGEFQMGSDLYDYVDEKPVHAVYLDAYNIDIYEVTNAQYAACVQAAYCTPPEESKSYTRSSYYGASAYADYPVIYVDWNQARTYCQWRGGDLPSEAQWEKAARGGLQGKKYPWGDEEPMCQKGAPNGAKFDDGAGCKGADTDPVGSYSPNGYGLYDMAGNVWEWVLDWYQETFYASSPSANPVGPSYGKFRVVRGGSWYYVTWDVRSAYRLWNKPDDDFSYVGFRCVHIP